MSNRPDPRAGGALRVLFFIYSLGYVRFFDVLLRELLDRGHAVHFIFEREDHEPNEEAWLQEMSAYPGFSYTATSSLRGDYWRSFSRHIRRSSDYLRYLRPEFREGGYLLIRAERRAPPVVRWLGARSIVRVPIVLRTLDGLFALLDRLIPPSRAVADELRAADADVFVLSPHLMPGARHSDYVKVARSIGLRTCMCIASWDNLSTKQLIHELPDHLVVWNETQRQEAITLHAVPTDRIEITGAHSFDRCFAWTPGDRAGFCGRFRLDPTRPIVLYVGGSLFPGELTESEFARLWIEQIRRADGLRDVSVLLRPHPNRVEQWDPSTFADLENVTLWPMPRGEMPIDEDARADYYDAIAHSAAVVGLNTSAMIESAIIGRPVHTILVPEFANSQRGTFHFDYLLEVGGGLLRVANSLAEHREQLATAVAGFDTEFEERRRRFLEAFVRPHGLARPVTPLVAGVVEHAAARGAVEEARLPLALRPLRLVLSFLVRFSPRRLRQKLIATFRPRESDGVRSSP